MIRVKLVISDKNVGYEETQYFFSRDINKTQWVYQDKIRTIRLNPSQIIFDKKKIAGGYEITGREKKQSSIVLKIWVTPNNVEKAKQMLFNRANELVIEQQSLVNRCISNLARCETPI